MSEHRDPVDGALDLLRSDEWTGSAYNPELESRLMQEFNRPQSKRRIGRTGWIIAAGALVAVSGVSFAAVGGVEKVKNWFVTVEFDGQTRHVELSGDGEATFDIQTEDGATAQVHVMRSEAPGSRTIEATVTQDDGMSVQREVQKKVRITADGAEADANYTLDDLGDAEPIHFWTDADGIDRELYMLPAEEGEGSVFYLATYADDESVTVRKLAVASHIDANLVVDPEVSVDEDGTMTLKLDDGQGRIAVMKFRIREAGGDTPTAPDVAVPGAGMIDIQPSGQVKIKLDHNDPKGETEDEDVDVDVQIEGGR